MDKPLVSVKMITYNHAPYIAQAIEGVLQQETNFPFELVIGEDCSTDGTREIVFDYQKKYPDIIKVITSDKNVGASENGRRTRIACRGRYIALCEGDDYWTSSLKLQRQVDFLEANPDFSICFHSVEMVWADGNKPSRIWKPPGTKGEYDIRELLRGNFVSTCSVVCRNGLFDKFPSWYYEMPIGDWPLFVLCAMHGKIGYIDECMGIYRRHPGGIYSGRDRSEQLNITIDAIRIFRGALGKRYHRLLSDSLCERYCRSAFQCFDDGELVLARTYAKRCVLENRHNLYIPSLKILKMFLKVYFNGPYEGCKRVLSCLMFPKSNSPEESNQMQQEEWH